MYHFMLVQVIFKLRIVYTALYCTFDQNGVSSKVPTSCFIVNTWAPFYQARVIIDPKIDSNFDPPKINYNF